MNRKEEKTQCPAQFSLRALLLLFVVPTPGFSLLVIRVPLGLAVSALMVAFYLVLLGFLSRNRRIQWVGLGIIGTMIVVFLFDLLFVREWHRRYSFTIPVHVVDEISGEVIPGARVLCLREHVRREKYSPNEFTSITTKTDNSGVSIHTTNFLRRIKASRLRILFDTGHYPDPIDLESFVLYVDVEGFQHFEKPLSELVGRDRWPTNEPPLPQTTIELEKLELSDQPR